MHHDISNDAGQRHTSHPAVESPSYTRRCPARYPIDRIGKYGYLINYMREQALYYKTGVGSDDFVRLLVNTWVLSMFQTG